MKKEPPRITPHHLDKEARYGIENEEEPEDLAIKGLSSFHPDQKEEDGQAIGGIIELSRVERNVQPG